MSRCILRALARTRLFHRRPLRLSRRCRLDAIPLPHLHIRTVRPTTDNPDPSPADTARPYYKPRVRRCLCSRQMRPSRVPSYFTVSYRGAPLSVITQYTDGQGHPL
jgi:hypothetical protein